MMRSTPPCEIGVRLQASRGSMSLGESKGGLPPDRVVEDEDAILKDSQRLIEHLPRSQTRRNDPDRAGALFALLGDHRPDAPERQTGA